MEKKNQIPKYPLLRFPEFTDEWKEVRLGEVTCERNETNTPTLPLLSITANKGVIPQTDSEKKDVSNADKSKYKRICSGDIGYNTMRMWQGRSALSFIEGIVSPAYTIVTPLKGVSPLFLSYLIKRPRLIYEFWTHSQGLVEDTLNCKYKDFAQITITIPSLPEQRKIAALFSLIDERIEVQNAIIKEQEAQKAALLRRLFDRTLRFPEFTDEWKKVKLGEVGKMYNGLSGKKAADFGAGYPFITYKMVFDSGVIDISKVSYVEIGPVEKQNKVREGDIFFTTSSETIDEVGMSSVLLRDADNLFLNSFCFGYRLNTPNLTTSQYLGYMLRGPQMRMRISSLGQGITRFNISKEKVADLQIAVPSLAEQKKIAGLLSLIDERIAVETEYAALLQKQKAYLLRQMFV